MTVQTERLGEFIRLARERKGLSQEELGQAIGVSRPTISLLERGQTVYPRMVMLEAIARTLEVDPTRLLDLAGITLPDAAARQLQWLSDQLEPRAQRLLLSIGHALLQEQQGRPEKERR